jgi:hypothetical protein
MGGQAKARKKAKKECAFFASCGNMATAIVCGGYHVCPACEKEINPEEVCEHPDCPVDKRLRVEVKPAPDPTWTCPLCQEVMLKKDVEQCLRHFQQHYVAVGLLEA